MNITSKSRYALKIMTHLAHAEFGAIVKRHEIVKAQHIPEKYLDQIISRLRVGGFVQSVRGRSGGYLLLHRADTIKVWDIFKAVEDHFYPVRCVDGHEVQQCELFDVCETRESWKYIYDAIKGTLEDMSLESVIRSKTGNKIKAEGFALAQRQRDFANLTLGQG
ncbi:MAG: Rrf2 family transcriptional regulator [Oligoflexales bacterium]